MQIFSLIIFSAVMLYTVWFIAAGNKKRRPLREGAVISGELLDLHIPFCRKLNIADKERFFKEVSSFLETVLITPVNTDITDIDKMYVAAGAVIPMFSFPGWTYPHLDEVLIYSDTFNMDFETDTDDRSIAGLVGTGVYKNKMMLSKTALRGGFGNYTDRSNTAIHEFVHLIDGADGDTDGVPNILLDKMYTVPWLDLIHEEMQKMNEGTSDINPYGLRSRSEFFAVASEYFFERPELFEENHPELFKMMQKIFRTQ